MELFDLYTSDRIKTGKTMVRGEQTPEGFYRKDHRSAHTRSDPTND